MNSTQLTPSERLEVERQLKIKFKNENDNLNQMYKALLKDYQKVVKRNAELEAGLGNDKKIGFLKKEIKKLKKEIEERKKANQNVYKLNSALIEENRNLKQMLKENNRLNNELDFILNKEI